MIKKTYLKTSRRKVDATADNDIAKIIADAAKEAHAQFLLIEGLMATGEKIVRSLSERIEAIGHANAQSRGHLAKVANAIKTTLEGHRDLSLGQWLDLRKQMATLRREIGEFTIMFFGRTMSGKSTTFEAFIQGDGSRIGNGVPDFTKDVEPMYWKGLRLIDTPGLEGFNERVREKALRWIDRSDVIAMVISDDHIEPILLERMAQIIRHNKPLIILLNIKCGNSDRLLQYPGLVFRPEEIKGHVQRIKRYLEDKFREYHTPLRAEDIPVFPYCAEAAFLAHRMRSDDPSCAMALNEASRFTAITEHVINLVRTRAIIIRVKAAYDAFMIRLQQIEDDLRIRLANVKTEAQTLEQKETEAREIFFRLQERAMSRFEGSIKSHFNNIEQEVEIFVDGVATGKEENPDKALNKIMGLGYIKNQLSNFRKNTVDDIQNQISQFEKDMKVDMEIIIEDMAQKAKLEYDSEKFHFDWGQFKRKTGKFGKIVGSPLAGAAATGLAAWAVTNFWNPSGWLAGLAAVGTVAVGAVTTWATHKGSKALEDSGKDTLSQERKKLRQDLMEKVQAKYTALHENNKTWVERSIEKARNTVLASIQIMTDRADEFRTAGRKTIHDMVTLRSNVACAQVKALLPLSYPKTILSEFDVVRAARRVSFRTKILVCSRTGQSVGGLLVGHNAENMRRLISNLGAEPIDIVEFFGEEWSVQNLRRAIRPAQTTESQIHIDNGNGNGRRVVVLTLDHKNRHLFFGPFGWNMQLCRELTNYDFKVKVEEGYDESQKRGN